MYPIVCGKNVLYFRLIYYLFSQWPISHSERPIRTKKQTTGNYAMPASKKPGWINWRSSAAQIIMLEDILLGGPDLLTWYKGKHPQQLNCVVLDQFEASLKRYRKNALKDYVVAQKEEEHFEHDRKIYPRQAYNTRGEPVFNMFPAKNLLREDINDELHITTYKTTRKLQESTPLEYGLFDRKNIAGRVCFAKKKKTWQIHTYAGSQARSSN
jgi:hypothetical protein